MPKTVTFYFTLTTLALIAAIPTRAQVTMTEFLRSVKTDYKVSSYETQITYLDAKTYRLSPLQKLEFRTRSNQLDPDRQDFGLRFTPANPWEIRSNNHYFQQYKSVLSYERDLALKEALVVRYSLIVDLLYFREIKALKEEAQRLVNAQVSIMEKQRQSDFFNAEDYVELKLDQMDRSVEFEEANFDLLNQFRKVEGAYPTASGQTVDWKYDQILSVDRIGYVIDSLYGLQLAPVSLKYRESMIDLANQEYKLEKSNINIGFVQAQYEPYRVEQDRKPWNVSLGVTIPITNPNKGDMTKRKLEAIEAEHERDETKAEIKTLTISSREQLKSLLLRYHDIKQKIQSLNVGVLSGTLNAIRDENPMATIRFNENLLKLRAIEVKLRQSILTTYIEFLGHTDIIQQTPLINFLSPRLEVIGN
jgi:hypothetical protein